MKFAEGFGIFILKYAEILLTGMFRQQIMLDLYSD